MFMIGVFNTLAGAATNAWTRHPCADVCISVFVCTDDACSWESREARGPQFLRCQLAETGFLEEGLQILDAAPSSMKACRLACSFLLVLEISENQSSPRFEDTSNFSESVPGV